MELTLLGTGTPMPVESRSGTSIAVTVEDRTHLVDCGPGTSRNLTEAGIDLVDVESIFFTHQHPDHNGGFPTFATTGWILGRRSLEIFGPEGTEGSIDALETMYEEYFELLRERTGNDVLEGLTDISYREVDDDFLYEGEGLRVTALPVEHVLPTFAYRFEEVDSGTSFVFSADTRRLSELAEFASGADLLIHEATLAGEVDLPATGVYWPIYDDPDEEIQESMKTAHSSAEDAAEIARDAGVERLILTHLMPHRDFVDSLAAAREIFDGSVTIAEDGLAVSVP